MSRSLPIPRWTKALLLGLALVLAVAVWACRRQIVQMRVQPGKAHAYRLSLVSTMVPPGQGKIERTSFEGVFNVRALPGERRALAFELSELEVQRNGKPAPAVAKALSAPFQAEVSPTGQFGSSRFLPETSRAERASLDGLVRSLEIVLPAERAAQWDSTESDQNGDYVSSYQRDSQSERLTKTKRRYTSLRQQAWVSLRVADSILHAELDPELWIRSAQLHEKQELQGPGGQVAATVEVETRVQPLQRRPDPSLAMMQENTPAKLSSLRDDPAAPTRSVWDELTQAERREEFKKAGVNLDVLLAKIGGTGLPRSTLSLQVSTYLQAFPEQAQTLSATIDHLPDPSAELLTNAMVAAGTQEAEGAVLGMLKKAEGGAERVRVLHALANAQNPSPRLVDAIFAALDLNRSDASWDVAVAAARTLNLLGTRASPVQETISNGLRERLGKADKARDQELLLKALHDCVPPIFVEVVTPFLRSPAADVRVAAAGLLASLSDPRATTALESLLADVADEPIRRAALSAMSTGPLSEPRSVMAARLLAEKTSLDIVTREGLVRYLAKGIQSYPQNRERLQVVLKHETSRPVIAAILNALSGGPTLAPSR